MLNIIKSVSLNELDLRFSESTAFDPSMGSDDTTAAFSLPFNFPVDIVALEQNITVGVSLDSTKVVGEEIGEEEGKVENELLASITCVRIRLGDVGTRGYHTIDGCHDHGEQYNELGIVLWPDVQRTDLS